MISLINSVYSVLTVDLHLPRLNICSYWFVGLPVHQPPIFLHVDTSLSPIQDLVNLSLTQKKNHWFHSACKTANRSEEGNLGPFWNQGWNQAWTDVPSENTWCPVPAVWASSPSHGPSTCQVNSWGQVSLR